MKHSMRWSLPWRCPLLSCCCVFGTSSLPPDMPAGHEYCLCSLGGFARARMELGGLPAALCSPSLSAGLECSHSLRFGMGPVFLGLSKHLYWEMFHLVSFWHGSRGVQSSIACLSFWALTWDAKTSHVSEALWGSKFCWLTWLLQVPVQAFDFPCNCGVWLLIFLLLLFWFSFLGYFCFSLWHEIRVSPLTPKAGQSVNH